MGGTCAVDLTVMHPELFSSFVDIAGDMGPNAGTKDQTIARLYGGNAATWAQFDPTTVIDQTRSVQGRFGLVRHLHRRPDPAQGSLAAAVTTPSGSAAATRAGNPGDQTAGRQLAVRRSAGRNGIACAVVPTTGRHDWPLATQVFTAALPWLAGAVHTPGVPGRCPTRAAARGGAASRRVLRRLGASRVQRAQHRAGAGPALWRRVERGGDVLVDARRPQFVEAVLAPSSRHR